MEAIHDRFQEGKAGENYAQIHIDLGDEGGVEIGKGAIRGFGGGREVDHAQDGKWNYSAKQTSKSMAGRAFWVRSGGLGEGGELQDSHSKGTHDGELSGPCHLDIVENVNG